MSSALTPLEEKIVGILSAAGDEALSLRQIEERLAQNGTGALDTFVVRDAVWGLIRKQRADFTPRRLVRVVGA